MAKLDAQEETIADLSARLQQLEVSVTPVQLRLFFLFAHADKQEQLTKTMGTVDAQNIAIHEQAATTVALQVVYSCCVTYQLIATRVCPSAGENPDDRNQHGLSIRN